MPARRDQLREEWVSFRQHGSEKSYRKLYEYYYQYLSFVGLKRGYATGKVKDCINDLFLYVWENAGKQQEINNFHNYLLTAFLHRLGRKEPFAAEASLELDDIYDTLREPSVEAVYIEEQAQAALKEALLVYLNRLPGRQREIIYQKFYLGLSYTQISEANNLSINTVYNTVYKTLEKLKTSLNEQHGDLLTLLGIAVLAALRWWSS